MAVVSVGSSGFDTNNFWVANPSVSQNENLENVQSDTGTALPLPGTSQTTTFTDLTFSAGGLDYTYRGLWTLTLDRGVLTGTASLTGNYSTIVVENSGDLVASYTGQPLSVDFGTVNNIPLVDLVLGLVGSLLGGFLNPALPSATAANFFLDATPNLPDLAFAGADTITGGSGSDALRGAASDDNIVGGAGNDAAYGSGGSDTLSGEDGDDYLDGGEGSDTLSGGNGGDYCVGGAGDDVIYGGSGSDGLIGGEGADQIYGGAGDFYDYLDGGAGNDRLFGEGGNDGILGGDGVDYLDGGDGNDYLRGDAGSDNILGGAGNDDIDGGTESDGLFGGDGNDILIGGAGNVYDCLDGGAGNDFLYGGGGNDGLIGGTGADTFYFYLGTEGTDYIVDYEVGIDRIYLDEFTGLGAGPLQPGVNFTVNTSAVTNNATIIYATTGHLYFDPDGLGSLAAVEFATFANAPVLTANDFVLV